MQKTGTDKKNEINIGRELIKCVKIKIKWSVNKKTYMTTGAKNYLMSRNTTTSVHLTGKQQNIGKLVISIKKKTMEK